MITASEFRKAYSVAATRFFVIAMLLASLYAAVTSAAPRAREVRSTERRVKFALSASPSAGAARSSGARSGRPSSGGSTRRDRIFREDIFDPFEYEAIGFLIRGRRRRPGHHQRCAF